MDFNLFTRGFQFIHAWISIYSHVDFGYYYYCPLKKKGYDVWRWLTFWKKSPQRLFIGIADNTSYSFEF